MSAQYLRTSSIAAAAVAARRLPYVESVPRSSPLFSSRRFSVVVLLKVSRPTQNCVSLPRGPQESSMISKINLLTIQRYSLGLCALNTDDSSKLVNACILLFINHDPKISSIILYYNPIGYHHV